MYFKNPKQLSIALIIIVTILVTIILESLGLFSRVESASFDHRVGIFRFDKIIHEDVVVVLIDEESLQDMADELGRWPWPRSAYRDLLDFFALAGAEAIAFDILFTEQQDAGENNYSDQVLVEATRRAGNTVHAMQLLHSTQTNKRRSLPEEFERLHALQSGNFVGQLYDDYLLPIEALYKASRDIGFLEIIADRDGVYRRIRLFNQFNRSSVFPSLASALVLPLIAGKNSIIYGRNKAEINDLQIPLDGDGNYLINPYGQVNTYSASQVFAAMKQIRAGENINLILDSKRFTGKLILLGTSAIGLLDVKATALRSKEAGVFLHAYTVSNLLQQDFLQLQPFVVSIAIVLLLCGITVIPVVLLPRILLASLFPVSAGIIYTIVAYSAFAFNHVFPVTPIIFAIIFSLLLAYSFRSYCEKSSYQKIRKMLAQYVSPGVLNAVIDNHEGLHGEVGTKEFLSILYLDIRNFTSISKSLDPSQVVDLLNIYFSEMTEIVFTYNGTLDKYVGDAIMAFWGAPIRITNHARKAVESAIDMRKRLHLINEKLIEKNYPRIDIDIGIHSGHVVLGNIGSDKKLDYTVIGRSVKLASYLAQLPKTYGCSLVFSEDTWEAMHASIPCMQVDRVRVKGKRRPINLYTPAELFRLESNLQIPTQKIQLEIQHAFSLYLQRDWQKAAKTYGQIGACVLTDLFKRRCSQYLSDEPDQKWDGVYTVTNK